MQLHFQLHSQDTSTSFFHSRTGFYIWLHTCLPFFFFPSFSVVIQEPVGNGMHLSHPGFRRSFTPDTPLALLTSDWAPSPALTSLLCQSDGRARGGRVSVPFSASVLSYFLSLNPLTYEDKGC